MKITKRPYRYFSKKNFGEKQNLLTFGVLFFFLASALIGVMNNLQIRSQLDDLGQTSIAFPEDYIQRVKALEAVELDRAVPTGEYIYQLKHANGALTDAKIIINDQTITRRVSVHGFSQLSGTADYHLVGSVMKYDNIKGDRYLFSEIGSPLRAYQDVVTIELDGTLQLNLYSPNAIAGKSTDSMEPITLSDHRSLMHKLFGHSFLSAMHRVLMVSGLGMLLYVLFMINFKPGKPGRPEDQGKMAA